MLSRDSTGLSDRVFLLARRALRFFDRHRRILRCWAIFIVVLEAQHLLLDWSGPPIWDLLDGWTARITAWSLNLLGAEATAEGKLVTSSLYSLRIIRECTAIHPVMIYLAAVVSYPCAWRPRVVGAVAGTVGILLVNQVRLVSLFYIGHSYPALFDTIHVLVWQSLIIFFTVLIWAVWASLVTPGHESVSA